jgi:hypothetical protein
MELLIYLKTVAEFRDAVSTLAEISDKINKNKVINGHVHSRIGILYQTAIEYLGSKRDRDTVNITISS